MIDKIIIDYEAVAKVIVGNECDNDLLVIVAILKYIDYIVGKNGPIEYGVNSINNANEINEVLDYLCSPLGRPKIYKIKSSGIAVTDIQCFDSVYKYVRKYSLA